MASTGAVRRHLAENPSNFDSRKFLKASTQAMQEICKARYEVFGCAGQASKIKPINLGDVTRLYESGELDPQVR